MLVRRRALTAATAEAFGEIVGIERSVGMLEAAQQSVAANKTSSTSASSERTREHTTFPTRPFDASLSVAEAHAAGALSPIEIRAGRFARLVSYRRMH